MIEHGKTEAFLRKTGAVEIIIEVGRSTATFQDLNDTIRASSSTLSSRLEEGLENEFFEVEYEPTDRGTQKRYSLTQVGTRIYDWAVKTELDGKIRKLRQVRQERETLFEELIGKLNRDRLVLGHEVEPGPVSVPGPEEIEHMDDFEPAPEEELREAYLKKLEEDQIRIEEKEEE